MFLGNLPSADLIRPQLVVNGQQFAEQLEVKGYEQITGQKDLSYLNENLGGALVPPPAQGPRFRKRKSVLSLADFKALRLKYRSKAWITVGGHPCEEGGGQHCEGTRVEVGEGGKVRKGPAGLRGRRLGGGKRPTTKPISSLQQNRSEATEKPKQETKPTQPSQAEAGNEPEEPKSKKSKAKVHIYDRDKNEVQELSKKLGVKDTADYASLVGAPDDAEVSVSTAYLHDEVVINLEVNHPQYQAERLIGIDEKGKKFIKNDTFFVKEGYQGYGMGTKVFSDQVAFAKQQGFAYIKTDAARSGSMNGYYTWARMGYDAPLENLYHNDRQKAQQAFPQAKTVQDIMATKEGRDWWKEHGGWINKAKFDLAEGSRSMKIHQAYLEERAKRSK